MSARATVRTLAPRIARLTGFLAVVGAGLVVVAPHLRHPAAADPARDLGDLGVGVLELVAPAGRPPRPGPRVLELNGQRLHLATATRAGGPADALADAAAACRPIGDAGDATGDIPAAPLRGGDDHHGFVACATWLTAAEAAADGDAPAALVSGYRYVYAEASGVGTVLITLWTTRPLDLAALFPATGDAPGRDPPALPRPPGGRRLLSAREPGQPQELTLYQVERGQRAALARWYRAALPARGWRALAGAARAPSAARDVLVVDRGGALAALVLADEADAGSVAILTSL